MDLKTMKTTLTEKQAAHARVSAEANEVRARLQQVSEAARRAKEYAEEKILFSVINPSPEAQAKADSAKANLTAAFEQETALRDRLSTLDRALQVLGGEIDDISRKIPGAEAKHVAQVLEQQLAEIDAELIAVSAKLYARAKARGTATFEFWDVVEDRLRGNGSRPGLRQRVLDAAEVVRTKILGGAL